MNENEPFPRKVGLPEIDARALIERLGRYGNARNRETEREPRTITITDDEALFLMAAILECISNAITIEGMSN